MTEKTPCPTCARPMKPKHTKGTDFMPFHHNTEGARCDGTGSVVNAKPQCEDCGTDYCYKLSDPATTVDGTECTCPPSWAANDHHEERCTQYVPVPGEEENVTDKGPWFGAMYDGRCSVNECLITEGDRIRADGNGGYECEDCGDFDDTMDRHVRVSLGLSLAEPNGELAQDAVERELAATLDVLAPMTVADAQKFMAPSLATQEYNDTLPMTADEFLDPADTSDVKPVMSVSGQPKKVRRDHLDRYAVVLPGETGLEVFKSSGKPVGRTRATTFNKAATDKKNINDWGKRNVVIGAARRRDLLLKAQGLTHENDRDRLNAIVKELEETAGSKVGSDLGSYLHEFTEYMDAGLKTWGDAPEEFRESLRRYAQVLKDAGLEPITSLIERTTIIREYGWVCGTFDRIFFHRPSGRYVIGDLKTGKTMDYGKNEVECQLWIYAHGVNQNGIYDWNTDTWGPAMNLGGPDYDRFEEVSETVGVVIHMPVQGPKEGTVELLWADLAAGARHAELCHAVRSQPKGGMKPWAGGPAPLAAPAERDWETEFRQATTGERASALWLEAKEAGITGVRLNDLIELARESIRGYASRVDT